MPVAALLLAALPTWFGLDIGLPRPLARELELLIVSEVPKPAPAVEQTVSSSIVPLPIPVESSIEQVPALPIPAVPKPRPIPSLAVAGVGLQGLVMRSEPAGGEQIRLVDEGTDLRDLDQQREAGGRRWKLVRHPDGPVGWVAADFLVPWDGLDRHARTLALLSKSAGLEPTAPRDRSWTLAPPELRSITPDQLKDSPVLSSWEAYAACGPAATVAFARAIGQDLTLDQATNAARLVGWNGALGMPGPRAELALLASVGVPAHRRGGDSEDTIDWERVIGDVQAGLPVMVVTSRHYFVAEGYDQATGKLDFGNSALVLAGARKQRWFTPDEIGWLGYGTPFTTIHLGPGQQPSEYLRVSTVEY